MNKYRCKHCKKIVNRDSQKAWIKSYCDEAGKNVHLMLVREESEGPRIDSAGLKREGPHSSASDLPEYTLYKGELTYNDIMETYGKYLTEEEIAALNRIRHEGQKVDSGAEVGLVKTQTITDPIIRRVVEKIVSRSEVGVKKYNTTLMDNDGDLLYWLNHLQEELMDAVNYIERLKHSLEVVPDSSENDSHIKPN